MTAGAVLYVSDLDRMRTFYAMCFGLSGIAGGPTSADFCVLVAGDVGWELTLVCVPAAVAATIVLVDPPERRENSAVKLVFAVTDLEVADAAVGAAGGRLDPISSAWEFRGHLHLDGIDPEGNVISLRQRLSVTR